MGDLCAFLAWSINTGEGHYKAGQLGAYKAGQVGAYKATHPLIWGARMTPIRPLFKKISVKTSKNFFRNLNWDFLKEWP